MYLKSVKYTREANNPGEWTLKGLSLRKKNLLVGKNASGKSRILNIILSLSQYLTGSKKPSKSGHYDVEFTTSSDKIIKYQLIYNNFQIEKEVVVVDNTVLLDRKKGGEGLIWAKEIGDGQMIRFQTPVTELAAVAKRDSIQHSFLEPFFAWGASLRHYQFGSLLGKDHLTILTNDNSQIFDEKDPQKVVPLYLKAIKLFDSKFKQIIIKDMSSLGYFIDNIGVGPPVSIRISGNFQSDPVCLHIREEDCSSITDQNTMSQGMFRALSILIQINYSLMAKKTNCIIIDDIGEGLDFQRSCSLINLIRKKISGSDIQLILSTNDQFIMNKIPLEEWSVIKRKGGLVKVFNNQNSPEIFEDFKFTGLSNFTFFELDLMSKENKGTFPDE